jgi:hypothetical protein
VRDEATQRVASSWRARGPIKGTRHFQASYLSGGFFHTPLCGLASSRSGFSDMNYLGKSLETTWPGFAWGSLAPDWSYGEEFILAGCDVAPLSKDEQS